jgi:hypothetical protein
MRAAAAIWSGSAAMNSDTRMPASRQGADELRQPVLVARDLQPAFGRPFLAPFGHDAGGVRPWASAMPCISSVAAISKFRGW